MFKILLHNNAAKAYNKLDDKTATRINRAIDALKDNPFHGKDIKRLRGKLKGKYRLRVGGYRIIYRIEEEEKVLIIEDIKLREKVY
jgi:mRNA interferase RelE/StbE